MFFTAYNKIFLLVLVAVFLVPVYTGYAEETYLSGTVMTTATFRWNNENWFTNEHPKIAEFTVRDDGSAFGLTETGIPFTQENVENELNIRIQRFVLQDHYHFIIGGNEVYSLEEFSKQLALAYESQVL